MYIMAKRLSNRGPLCFRHINELFQFEAAASACTKEMESKQGTAGFKMPNHFLSPDRKNSFTIVKYNFTKSIDKPQKSGIIIFNQTKKTKT